MARENDAAWDRGATYGQGRTPMTADDVTATEGILGMVKVFEDVDYASTDSAKPRLSTRRVVCVAVRNEVGSAITPGQVIQFVPGSPYKITVAAATANLPYAYIADEYLPTAGAIDDDVFWAVMVGPCKVNVTSSGTTAVGTPLASTATAGRAGVQGTPGDATAARDQAYAVLGTLLVAAANGTSQVRFLAAPNIHRFYS